MTLRDCGLQHRFFWCSYTFFKKTRKRKKFKKRKSKSRGIKKTRKINFKSPKLIEDSDGNSIIKVSDSWDKHAYVNKSKYQKKYNFKPVYFTKVENKINVNVSKISKILRQDVSWRFQIIGQQEYNIYDLKLDELKLDIHQPEILNEYSEILFELINYRWIQQLEKFNSSPRISKKVNGTDREDIKRGNLSRFKTYLDIENPNRECFISGKKIEDDLSIDHVLPWSYLFSDDIWNLVYVKKNLNSSKSNKIPNESMIKKLELRNIRLLDKMKKSGINDKRVIELETSIKKDYVREFWYGCKG